MSEKDIKTKPVATPKTPNIKGNSKIAVKSKEAVTNTVKDAKSVMKDALVRKAVETKLGTDTQQGQPQKADTEAAESVESAAYTTADTAYHKGKTYAQNKIREHRANKVKTKDEPELPEEPEQPETPNEPKQADNQPETKESQEPKAEQSGEQKKPDVKTKEQYLKNQKGENADGVKTKESYIDGHATSESRIKGVKDKKSADNISADNAGTPAPQNAREEYVKNKLKTKTEYEKVQTNEVKADTEITHGNAPKETGIQTKGAELPAEQTKGQPNIKTKENYMQSLRAERTELVKSPYGNSPKSKQGTTTVKRSTANSKKALKTRDNVVGKSKSVIKSSNAHTAKTTRKTAKTAKKAVKTQKEVAKKATKETAKRAKQAAQKAAQVAKAVARVTAKAAIAIAKVVAAGVKALVSAIAAFGGWAILIVVLIVIIIVAAIAASPFGIFITEEAAGENSIPLSAIVAECNAEVATQMDSIEAGTPHNRVVVEGETADWGEILAVFAVKVAGTGDEMAQDVVIIDEAKKQILKEVFWAMHSVTSRTETVTSGNTSETVLYITIQHKTKDDMAAQYGFTDKQKEALATLLENNDILLASTQSLAISDASAKEILDNLPEDLPEERKAVMRAACSLVGKVTYFWGGKYNAMGWNPNWGKMMQVTAAGSSTTGSMRPLGLDCSGFVSWVFVNAGFSNGAVGEGTTGQLANSTRISEGEAQPGDLTFNSDVSHVGIIAGRDANGNVLVIHCSSGANRVVISTGSLGTVARPNCY